MRGGTTPPRLARDSVLFQRMWTAMQPPRVRAVKLIAGAYHAADDLLREAAGDESKFQDVLHTVGQALKGQRLAIEQAREQAAANAQKVWDAHVATMKQAAAYKAKLAVRFIGPIAGLAVSIALLAATPVSGGAGLAFAALGMMKSIIQLSEAAADASRSTEEQVKAAKTCTRKAGLTWNGPDFKRKKDALRAQQIGSLAIKELFGKSPLDDLTSCKNKVEGAQRKVADLYGRLNTTSKKLGSALDAAVKVRTRAEKRAAAKGNHPRVAAANKQLIALEQGVQGTIAKIGELHKRYVSLDQKAKVTAAAFARVAQARESDLIAFEVVEKLFALKDVAVSPVEAVVTTTVKEIMASWAPAMANALYDMTSDAIVDRVAKVR